MEWFLPLTLTIKSFQELFDKFIAHYAYNCEHEITMSDFCKTKKNMRNSLYHSYNNGEILLKEHFTRFLTYN